MWKPINTAAPSSWGLPTASTTPVKPTTGFLRMMREHEEFEVETDRAGELPMPFLSETVRRVVVE